jgi:hypothetical protein
VPGRDGFDQFMHKFTFSQIGGMCLEWGLSCGKVDKLSRGYSFDLICDKCGVPVFFARSDPGLVTFDVKVKAMCQDLNPVFYVVGGPRERTRFQLNFAGGLRRMLEGGVRYIGIDSVFSRLKRAMKGTHVEALLLLFLTGIGRCPCYRQSALTCSASSTHRQLHGLPRQLQGKEAGLG